MMARRSAGEAMAKPAENVGATSLTSSAFSDTKKEALCIFPLFFFLVRLRSVKLQEKKENLNASKDTKIKQKIKINQEREKKGWSLKSR
jgi:hypothetical protein